MEMKKLIVLVIVFWAIMFLFVALTKAGAVDIGGDIGEIEKTPVVKPTQVVKPTVIPTATPTPTPIPTPFYTIVKYTTSTDIKYTALLAEPIYTEKMLSVNPIVSKAISAYPISSGFEYSEDKKTSYVTSKIESRYKSLFEKMKLTPVNNITEVYYKPTPTVTVVK